MENIGDWLYVVILIIAGVSSLFGSLVKKKNPAEQQRPVRDIFEEILIPQPVETEVETVPKRPKAVSSKRFKSSKSPVFPEYQSLETGEAYSSIMPKVSEKTPVAVEEEYQVFTAEDLPSDVDEWRKALIYNEIFNRKY